MNIRDLARLTEFELETATFGPVRCGNLKVSDMDAVECVRKEDKADAETVARLLFSRLAHPREIQADVTSTDQATAYFDGAALTLDEVERFAEQLAKSNRYLGKTGDKEYLQRDLNETHAAFLLRMIDHHRAVQRERWEKLMRPVTSSIFGNTTRSAWEKSVLATERLESSVKALRATETLDQSLRIPRIENSMRGTNDRLDTLVDRLDQYRPTLADAATAVGALVETVCGIQADYTSNSDKANKQLFRTELVAIGSFLITTASLGASIYFSNKQVNDDSVVKELRAIRAEQQADREALDKALRKLAEIQAAKASSPVKAPQSTTGR